MANQKSKEEDYYSALERRALEQHPGTIYWNGLEAAARRGWNKALDKAIEIVERNPKSIVSQIKRCKK